MKPIDDILAGIYAKATNPDELDPLSAELEICAALNAWCRAQSGRDIARLAKLYHPAALAWHHDSSSLEGLAQLACSADLVGSHVTVQTQHVQVHEGVAIHAGILRYETSEKRTSISVPLRFTFTYLKTDHRWLIVSQHLSRMPAG